MNFDYEVINLFKLITINFSLEYFGNINSSIFAVYKSYKHHISNVSTKQGSPNYGSQINFNRLVGPHRMVNVRVDI